MTIKELCKISHKQACEKGFWEHAYDLSRHPSEQKILKERNLSELLMLIVSELGEAQEALRNNNRQDYRKVIVRKQIDKIASKWLKTQEIFWRKDTFEDEIADTFIRLADMCRALGIDIEWQIKKKMEYNKTRPAKHGKEF